MGEEKFGSFTVSSGPCEPQLHGERDDAVHWVANVGNWIGQGILTWK